MSDDSPQDEQLRLFSPTQIRWAGVLGTWAGGYWLLALNHLFVRDVAGAVKALFSAAVATVLLLVGGPIVSMLIAFPVGTLAEQVGVDPSGTAGMVFVPLLLASGFIILWIGVWFATASAADSFAAKLENGNDKPTPWSSRSDVGAALLCAIPLVTVGGMTIALFGTLIASFQSMV